MTKPPPRSDENAIVLPSGDARGSRGANGALATASLSAEPNRIDVFHNPLATRGRPVPVPTPA